MQKTIVVEVTRKKAHPLYKRVISIRKKFYAHDEKNEAHVGDVVQIEESRPLSQAEALDAERNHSQDGAGAGNCQPTPDVVGRAARRQRERRSWP